MHIVKAVILSLAFILPTNQAWASQKVLGQYGDWSAHTRYQGVQKICFVISHAKTKSPSSVRHGDIHFMVANWKSGAAFEQPSFMADFSLKSEREPTIKIGRKNFPMYVSQNEAFIADDSVEQDLVNNMRAGSTMRISAVSSRGTNVSYSFSLRGVTAALKKASDACQ